MAITIFCIISQTILLYFSTLTSQTVRWYVTSRQDPRSNIQFAIPCIQNQVPLLSYNGTTHATECLLSCYTNRLFDCVRVNYFYVDGRCDIYQSWSPFWEFPSSSASSPTGGVVVPAIACTGFEKKDLCPFNFTYLPADRTCVRLFYEYGRMAWQNATNNCSSLGPGYHLAVVDPSSKGLSVASYMKIMYSNTKAVSNCYNTDYGAWTSGGRSGNDTFYWFDPSGSVQPFSSVAWRIGEPSYSYLGMPENCVQVLSSGLLNDVYCTFELCYLCEVKPNYM